MFGPNIKKMLTEKDVEGLKSVVIGGKNQATKVKAIEALVELKETKALISMMTDPGIMVLIIPQLVKIGEEVVQPLIAALDTKDKFIAGSAATALSLMNADAALEPIITKAKDPSCPARIAMIVALGSYSKEEVKTTLQQLTTDKNAEVGQAAMMSLGKVLTRR